MANIDVTLNRFAPVGGASSEGDKLGSLRSTTKAAQNDTITITDAVEVLDADLRIAATGVAEPYTISGKEITLTSATTGSVRGKITYR